MITDAVMEVLSRMIDLTTGTAYAEGIMMVHDVLGDFDEDKWYSMTRKERDDWLVGIMRKQVTI